MSPPSSLLYKMFGEFRPSLIRTIALAVHTREANVAVGTGFRIKGMSAIQIEPGSRVRMGTIPYGFADGRDQSLVRVRGQLTLGSVGIASGNRWDIGPHARVIVGDGTYFSPNVRLITTKGITVGRNCAVGWDVQFLDTDFHTIARRDDAVAPRADPAPITIGDHVWIGSHAKIFRGVHIADDCVVAANATVVRSVTESGSLIAGSPARVVRREITWG